MVLTKFTALAAVVAISGAAAAPRIDPSVHRTLRQQGTVNLIVTMRDSNEAPLKAVQEASYATRGAKIEALVERLSAHAETSQKDVEAITAHESSDSLFTESRSYWISNQRYIKGATVELLEKLAAVPSILEVREEQILHLPKLSASSVNATASTTNEWGVVKVGAPTVWAGGNKGEGIVVSSIDSGVLGTHEALKGNFRADHGWYDPSGKKTAPYDAMGHGTHTMGTIAGANGIGVAPGSTWISCKGCGTEEEGCSEADLLSCAQWITCPTDTSGNNKDCSKAPHLVSNSWGGGQGDTFYKAAVDSWQAAGIIPIFANGNEGPACTTASSPGDYDNVIAVGATDSKDALADFSSKGPTKNGGLLKPEVSAPGVDVRSAWLTGNTAYNTISGTSMATPHVSGVVALLLKAKPGLTYDQVKDALIHGVDTSSLASTGATCGNTKDGVFPNNMYGYGRVNAVKVLGGSSSPTSAPSPTPTARTPAPTTRTPTPTSTRTPAPTTRTPAPTTRTPAPTTQAPSTCSALDFYDCYYSDNCYWDWSSSDCVDYSQ
ncbi:hypothetical protein Poli38472_003810 [Pythium oligandrum]|uniref:subtilisin n=1 Tax=Pythium oligandrum TaxID=41045 RepID=A0A8K1FJG5_PYTOL|nr:hypothetical protein Poli38472_003810 [Pythium oligandrum]|eukprot:TMW66045.1 hypothetical protein Poli38472_003810 [Pythium oligandrum]